MIKAIVLALLLAMVTGHTSAALASTSNYFNRHAQGWFWYENPPVEVKPEEPPPAASVPAQAAPASPDDPLEQLKRIQDAIARAEAKAVLYPTVENVTEYLRLNQWQLNQSALFSDVWRRTVWQDPSLDYSLQRPTTSLAVHQFQDQRNRARAQAVAQVANTHGLFFFFKGSCPYCHTFAPVLRQFSQMYGIEVLPISLDGGSLPDFPSPRIDSRVATELGVKVVPSVFLVEPNGRNVIPVGSGVMSVDELAERIFVLTQTEPGKDY